MPCLGGVYVNCTPANNRNLFYQCWILSFPGDADLGTKRWLYRFDYCLVSGL